MKWTACLSDNEVSGLALQGRQGPGCGERHQILRVTGPCCVPRACPMTCAAPIPTRSMTALISMWRTRPNGDMYDNYLIRIDEIRQSLRILQQAVKQIPEGPINSQKPQYQVRVPAGEVLWPH